MKEKVMTLEEVKELVCKVIGMNGKDDFIHAPSVSLYPDGMIIVSCHIINRTTSESEYAQSTSGNLIKIIEDKKEIMLTYSKEFIETKKAELRAELKKLEDIKRLTPTASFAPILTVINAPLKIAKGLS